MKPMNKLILGSQSPRRHSLLKDAGFAFEVQKLAVDESFPDTLKPVDVAEFLAKEKNSVYRKHFPGYTILTADTVVIHADQILGKPVDANEAERMLRALSDDIHEVVTGVYISDNSKSVSFRSVTQVKTKALSAREIDHYISHFRPYDKAGAYGIQEWFGLIAVEWIQGSFYNVVGLPIDLVYKTLVETFNIHPFG